uniref:Uncharacterized protein n=1 Tax=Hyaloperonospora arabidopsidis (strain Emoy2) TaxID=559515 RepID=M4B9R2_HYAAE
MRLQPPATSCGRRRQMEQVYASSYRRLRIYTLKVVLLVSFVLLLLLFKLVQQCCCCSCIRYRIVIRFGSFDIVT